MMALKPGRLAPQSRIPLLRHHCILRYRLRFTYLLYAGTIVWSHYCPAESSKFAASVRISRASLAFPAHAFGRSRSTMPPPDRHHAAAGGTGEIRGAYELNHRRAELRIPGPAVLRSILERFDLSSRLVRSERLADKPRREVDAAGSGATSGAFLVECMQATSFVSARNAAAPVQTELL
jgi:hypothetical protein